MLKLWLFVANNLYFCNKIWYNDSYCIYYSLIINILLLKR